MSVPQRTVVKPSDRPPLIGALINQTHKFHRLTCQLRPVSHQWYSSLRTVLNNIDLTFSRLHHKFGNPRAGPPLLYLPNCPDCNKPCEYPYLHLPASSPDAYRFCALPRRSACPLCHKCFYRPFIQFNPETHHITSIVEPETEDQPFTPVRIPKAVALASIDGHSATFLHPVRCPNCAWFPRSSHYVIPPGYPFRTNTPVQRSRSCPNCKFIPETPMLLLNSDTVATLRAEPSATNPDAVTMVFAQ
jgi:hypothetical protein